MRDLDGMRIMGPADGEVTERPGSKLRELISPAETGSRWSLGEVVADPDEHVGTHVHPGEPEAFIILEGEVELHGSDGVARLSAGDIVFIPPDTEHGLRTPTGGRWIAVWPVGERLAGKRYAS